MLLGPTDVRRLAETAGFRPRKALGQNFVVDAGTVRKVVARAGAADGDVVLEVGPGLGSLTLGLLEAGLSVVAVEVDPLLAELLPRTVAERAGAEASGRLEVVTADALRADVATFVDAAERLGRRDGPDRLAANLPYNVGVPVLLRVLDDLPSVRGGVVMVQAEVADRLIAGPGSRTYGSPSVKLAWHARAHRAGTVGPAVFWPVPRVDSALVALERVDPPTTADGATVDHARFRAVVDAAFAQRRKTLRAALSGPAGSAAAAEAWLRAAGLDPSARGEVLGVEDFVALARAAGEVTAVRPTAPPT